MNLKKILGCEVDLVREKLLREEIKSEFKSIEIKEIPLMKCSLKGIDALYSLYKDYIE